MRALGRALLLGALGLVGAATLGGCPSSEEGVRARGQTKLTLLHTSDVHSRLFPYSLQIAETDSALGLGVAGEVAEVGGAARLAWLAQRERARADRVLHIDGGDCFQGAPVYNFFDGEAEVRAMSAMGVDAQSLANHEFDKGALTARNIFYQWANYPVLTANYRFDDPETVGSPDLDDVLQPFTTFDLRGLKVGVIGMGNLSSLSSLYEQPNRLGVTPLETIDTAQTYVDLLRPLVDVVVFVTHLGLGADQEMIEGTTGIDVVLGGHNHIVLQPPKVLTDCAKVDAEGRHYVEVPSATAEGKKRRYCAPRQVVLAHSGAFAKYLGRLDLVVTDDPRELPPTYQAVDGFEVLTHDYRLFPVNAAVPEDTAVKQVLEPYREQLGAVVDLDLLVGYAPDGSRRIGAGGGDSALGNLISTAMWRRLGIETDFSLTNTTGIRTDVVPGPVTLEQMFNVFPFDNSVTKMQLSGVEVQELFDFVARRSASRGCSTQVQIAGARVVIDCGGCAGRAPVPCSKPDDCVSGVCTQGKCEVGACAQHIYIGYTERPCANDADCNGLPNACDGSRPDSQGRGRCRLPIDPTGSYELATSTYLAQGGSGFVVLKRNTTQLDTKVQQRDALVDWVRAGKPCGFRADAGTPEGLLACATDADCGAVGQGFVCACPENAGADASGACQSTGSCGDRGRCVLRSCRQEVSELYEKRCADPETSKQLAVCTTRRSSCELGGEQCKYLACLDASMGSVADGRILMVGR